MDIDPNHNHHIRKPILHPPFLVKMVYRIRLLFNPQIQITHETKKNQNLKG